MHTLMPNKHQVFRWMTMYHLIHTCPTFLPPQSLCTPREVQVFIRTPLIPECMGGYWCDLWPNRGLNTPKI